jgi:hypothetical protein
MKKFLKVIFAVSLSLGFLMGCGNDECDEDIQDYDGDGSAFDAGDYDTMKELEERCEKNL